MNQIPNIEKTMRRGIKLIAGRIEALHPQYFLDETTYKHDVKGTMDVVKGVMADIEETHHQQLQKAREEERERIITILDDYEIDGEWQRNEMLRKIIADIAEINYTDLGKSSL